MNTYLACVGAEWGHQVVDRVDAIRHTLTGNPKDGELLTVLRDLEPRYVFFLNWSRIVPKEITDAYTCVNFHCTPLPYGRGGHPIENLILRGHEETVITAHRMTEVVDGGPIYGASPPVSLAGTKEDILGRFVEPVAEMIRWIIEAEPEPIEQEELEGDWWKFKRLAPDVCEAIWEHRERGVAL